MAKLLLVKLLEPDPIKRYSADRALSHPWITKKIHSNICYVTTFYNTTTFLNGTIQSLFNASTSICNYITIYELEIQS